MTTVADYALLAIAGTSAGSEECRSAAVGADMCMPVVRLVTDEAGGAMSAMKKYAVPSFSARHRASDSSDTPVIRRQHSPKTAKGRGQRADQN